MSGCPDCTPTKLCKWHKRRAEAKQPKPLRRTPLKKKVYKIKPRTDKRAKIDSKYNRRAVVWKKENPYCQAKLEGCTYYTVDCHHIEPRTEHNILIESNWMAVCRSCHDKIKVLPIDEAVEMGLSIRRNN